jgi:hypothetical protein
MTKLVLTIARLPLTLIAANLNRGERADLISRNPRNLTTGGIVVLLIAPIDGYTAPAPCSTVRSPS